MAWIRTVTLLICPADVDGDRDGVTPMGRLRRYCDDVFPARRGVRRGIDQTAMAMTSGGAARRIFRWNFPRPSAPVDVTKVFPSLREVALSLSKGDRNNLLERRTSDRRHCHPERSIAQRQSGISVLERRHCHCEHARSEAMCLSAIERQAISLLAFPLPCIKYPALLSLFRPPRKHVNITDSSGNLVSVRIQTVRNAFY